jgi:hypothetical protein
LDSLLQKSYEIQSAAAVGALQIRCLSIQLEFFSSLLGLRPNIRNEVNTGVSS